MPQDQALRQHIGDYLEPFEGGGCERNHPEGSI
jgi:hypothetical protein